MLCDCRTWPPTFCEPPPDLIFCVPPREIHTEITIMSPCHSAKLQCIRRHPASRAAVTAEQLPPPAPPRVGQTQTSPALRHCAPTPALVSAELNGSSCWQRPCRLELEWSGCVQEPCIGKAHTATFGSVLGLTMTSSVPGPELALKCKPAGRDAAVRTAAGHASSIASAPSVATWRG